MIYRKIFKVKTTGSRKTNNLRPDFIVPKGINYAVHEYNEREGWCILECWCSDNALLNLTEQKKQVDLDLLNQDKNVLAVLTSHPFSPATLGTVSVSGHSAPIEKFDEKKKTVTVNGKTVNYVRKTKEKDTANREMEVYVLDEG